MAAKSTYPPGQAPLEARLGQLTWDTNSGKCLDDDLGTSLRNWEEGGSRAVADIGFLWGEQPWTMTKLHVFYAWRSFPVARMSAKGHVYEPDYLKAIWANETTQTKRLELDVAEVPLRFFVDPGTWGRPHGWSYAKLVGETADGKLFDVRGWSLGSTDYRKTNSLPALPELPAGTEPKFVERPAGDRQIKTRWEPIGTGDYAPGHP